MNARRHVRCSTHSADLIVQFDRRDRGKSTPSASLPTVDLSTDTTQALVAGMKRPRAHLGIDRWLVWGGSWGTTDRLASQRASSSSP